MKSKSGEDDSFVFPEVREKKILESRSDSDYLQTSVKSVHLTN